jgi:hypothetical protein
VEPYPHVSLWLYALHSEVTKAALRIRKQVCLSDDIPKVCKTLLDFFFFCSFNRESKAEKMP